MAKITHSQRWGTLKTVIFWIGGILLLGGIGMFPQGGIAQGTLTIIIGLVIMGAALKIKNKNQWND